MPKRCIVHKPSKLIKAKNVPRLNLLEDSQSVQERKERETFTLLLEEFIETYPGKRNYRIIADLLDVGHRQLYGWVKRKLAPGKVIRDKATRKIKFLKHKSDKELLEEVAKLKGNTVLDRAITDLRYCNSSIGGWEMRSHIAKICNIIAEGISKTLGENIVHIKLICNTDAPKACTAIHIQSILLGTSTAVIFVKAQFSEFYGAAMTLHTFSGSMEITNCEAYLTSVTASSFLKKLQVHFLGNKNTIDKDNEDK